MKRVIVLGGGYAGLTAAGRLRHERERVEVILIDRLGRNQARPLLPDMIDRGLTPASVLYPLRTARETRGCQVLEQDVSAVDLRSRTVSAGETELSYDFLIVACGMVSEYHGVAGAREHSHPFRDVADACAVRQALEARPEDTLVVVGGGYTGVEAMTHAWRLDRRRERKRRLVLVEVADRVCPGTPEAFQDYASRQMQRLGIEMRLGTGVSQVDPDGATLSDGERVEPAIVVWTAGVSAAEPVASMAVPKTRQGRLTVDAHLQVADGCFAAGDAAGVERDGKPLRMGVQFALSEGRCAAENVLRLLRGDAPRPFKPVDLGYLIPMGHGRACGRVLGRRVWGRTAMALHYAMCIFRTYGLRRRWHVLRELCA